MYFIHISFQEHLQQLVSLSRDSDIGTCRKSNSKPQNVCGNEGVCGTMVRSQGHATHQPKPCVHLFLTSHLSVSLASLTLYFQVCFVDLESSTVIAEARIIWIDTLTEANLKSKLK